MKYEYYKYHELYRVPIDWYEKRLGHSKCEIYLNSRWKKTVGTSIIDIMECDRFIKITKEEAFMELI